jgi:hypothetical protein
MKGLAPEHVEQSDFVAECRYVETIGDVWVILQQKPPHIMAQVQLTKDEADFDIKLGKALKESGYSDFKIYYITGGRFFCYIGGGCNKRTVPALQLCLF